MLLRVFSVIVVEVIVVYGVKQWQLVQQQQQQQQYDEENSPIIFLVSVQRPKSLADMTGIFFVVVEGGLVISFVVSW